ncbi:MAG TPA: STM4011 family radical SAM protein [Herpetosiphonaceae bacterium]|nr:STM4011 family radical SAM protein [Herpetosiphonaceae bacterium]
MNLSILYRGPLSSCNYTCPYCPFAKHAETRTEHDTDARALARFLDWVERRDTDQISVFFTPWGEALIRKRYQQALARLTNLPHVEKAAIQTNLSCPLDWIDRCDTRRLGLWATFHPGEVPQARFLARCLELDRRGVRFSVGVVGLKEHAEAIEALRRELPRHIYLWINAYKRVPDYYTPLEIEQLTAIDPLFPINNRRHPSLGRDCRCGSSVISVDGDGTIRRCHFVRTPIGNIYEPGFEQLLEPRPCPNTACGCHIGYVHMQELALYDVFGQGVLERIPARPIWLDEERA